MTTTNKKPDCDVLINQSLDLFRMSNMKSIVVGCSGGADSMLLLNKSHSWGCRNNIPVRAIHVNHGLQDSNDNWEKFVVESCKALSIPCEVFSLNLPNGSNLEEVARDGRISSVRDSILPGEWYLTAHHANDQAENIIMSLARGGGHYALSGMQQISNSHGFISGKPLLGFSKKDIYESCAENSIKFVEDPTNFESKQDRNFIRNEIIPLLETRWPNFINGVGKSCSNISKLSKCIISQVDVSSAEFSVVSLSSMSDIEDEHVRIWLKSRFKKSAGSNIINSIKNLGLSREGQVLNTKGFNLGIWKNTLYDLSISSGKPDYCESHKYRKDLFGGVKINGITRSLKKIFKEHDIKPWERDSIPFKFFDGELKYIGSKKVS